MGVRHDSGNAVPVDATLRHTFLLVQSGSVTIVGRFPDVRAGTGDLIVIRPSTPFGARPDPHAEFVALLLHERFVSEVLYWRYPIVGGQRALARDVRAHSPAVQRIRFPSRARAKIGSLIEQVATLPADTPIFTSMRLALGVIDAVHPYILATDRVVLEAPGEGPVTGLIPRREVERMRRLLHARYTERWTMDRLAGEANMSVSTLRRAFRSDLGVTPMQYLRRLRISRFEQLVTDSNMTFTAAAHAVGLESTGHLREHMSRIHANPASVVRSQSRRL
ncbi:hypothetical protein ASF96_13235 [Microbacterium sp. Leaf179]|nr:hypothetical protein ASF96_13235 [Microbacterium sp. Leaf179]